jgi:hypothetical protein
VTVEISNKGLVIVRSASGEAVPYSAFLNGVTVFGNMKFTATYPTADVVYSAEIYD